MILLCLAKSWKFGGRCLAGIELVSDGGQLRIVRDGAEPRWIRPVINGSDGAIPIRLVQEVALLDIIELSGARRMPAGYQSENVLFTGLPPRRIAIARKPEEVLSRAVTTRRGPLFGNKGKAVAEDQAPTLGHSLVMVQAADASFFLTQGANGNDQVRARFRHDGINYDLPVTDPEFVGRFLRRGSDTAAHSCYLTLSLGLPWEGWHFKLVAGVFRM